MPRSCAIALRKLRRGLLNKSTQTAMVALKRAKARWLGPGPVLERNWPAFEREFTVIKRTLAIIALLAGCSSSEVTITQDAPAGGSELDLATTNQAGENLAGLNLAATNLVASNLAGTNLAGLNLGGNNLAATNLAGNNLAATNLAGNNLAGMNLAGNNLAGNNLAANNLAATNLAATNLAGNNLAGNNLAGTNLAGTNLSGSTVAGLSALHGSPIAGTRLSTTPTFGVGGAGVNIHNLGAASGMLASGEELFTRNASCVVLGVGSTAFSRLVTDNGAGPMFGALKKLPWGFTTTSGGAVVASAWEIVVWGPSRYCVFIVASAPSTTFQGVRGFVKAVFRWNATPNVSMTIGELGGTTAAETYTGMMGAAAKLADGTLDDRLLLAGELAFATATTNNVSVKVDFASWVRTKAGTKIILGNVGPGPDGGLPEYIEGTYTVTQRPDAGEVSLSLFQATHGTTSLKDFDTAVAPQFQDYQAGLLATKPSAKRCMAAEAANVVFRDSVPAGKCDSYTAHYMEGRAIWTGSMQLVPPNSFQIPYHYIERATGPSWSSVLGASAVKPHNDTMTLPDAVKRVERMMVYDAPTNSLTPSGTTTDVSTELTLSETFVALNEDPVSACTPETDAAFCARLYPAAACGDQSGYDNCNTARWAKCNCAAIAAPAGVTLEVEPNNLPSQAMSLAPGTSIWAQSLSSAEHDWVKVPLAPTQSLYLTRSSSCKSELFWPDATGKLVADPHMGTGLGDGDQYVSNRTTTTTTAYIRLDAFGGASGCTYGIWASATAYVTGDVGVPTLTIPSTTGLRPVTATVSIPRAVAIPTVVHLNLSNGVSTVASWPARVTIPANATSATFVVTPLSTGNQGIMAAIPKSNWVYTDALGTLLTIDPRRSPFNMAVTNFTSL